MSTLIVFARPLARGQVKTHLAAAVGEKTAIALHTAFLTDTCALTAGLGARRVLAVAGSLADPALARLAKSQRLDLYEQGDGDLGVRLERALAHFAPPVCILDSHAPTLPRAHLHAALDALMEHEVVLGPTDDGSYYLLGAAHAWPELFVDVPWSTTGVLAATRRNLAGRSLHLLPSWYQVDEVADLRRLRSDLESLPLSAAPATRRLLAALPPFC
jgi:rSAM/selenodomain-associated transferase 1